MIEHEDADGNIIQLPEHPGAKLLDCLNRLKLRLDKSGVERTAGLRDVMGNNCHYFRKSLDLFIKFDWDEIEALVKESKQLFDNFGGKK